ISLSRHSLVRRNLQTFIILFLILSQLIIFGLALPANIASRNQALSISPIDNDDTFDINDVSWGCYGLFVYNDLVIAHAREINFLDISKPTNPTVKPFDSELERSIDFYTFYNNTMLFSKEEIGNNNYSLNKINLDGDINSYSEIPILKGRPWDILLTNDYFFFYRPINESTMLFDIYNATNLDNLVLLGNTSITTSIDERFEIIYHDNFIYAKSVYGGYFEVYQINNTYQLEFVRKYSFPDLESISFYENYLYICNDDSLQLFDCTDPGNLTYISHFDITEPHSIQIKDNIGYLTTSESFTILDLSNISAIEIIDQYLLSDKDGCKLGKIVLQENLAIVLTQEYSSSDYHAYYGGYLYIFDIELPESIVRLYPRRLPSLNDIVWAAIIWGTVLVVLPVIVIVSIFVRNSRMEKGKMRRYEDLDKKKYFDKD
ncbi:MAG: hypothetical protein ACTSWD_17545, partial [Candidatus Heimdallarchaeota archaeon]